MTILMSEMEPTEVKFLVSQSLLSLQALPPVAVVVDHVGRLAAPRHGEVAELRDELRVHRPLRFDALALLHGRFALGLRCRKNEFFTDVSVAEIFFHPSLRARKA